MNNHLNQQANEQAIRELRSQIVEYSERFIEPFVTAGKLPPARNIRHYCKLKVALRKLEKP